MEYWVQSHDLVSDTDVFYQLWCYSYGTVKSAWPASWLVRSGSQSDWWVCSWLDLRVGTRPCHVCCRSMWSRQVQLLSDADEIMICPLGVTVDKTFFDPVNNGSNALTIFIQHNKMLLKFWEQGYIRSLRGRKGYIISDVSIFKLFF